MSKKKEENIALARKQAEDKLTTLQSHLLQLEKKREEIDNQIVKVRQKVEKINYFLDNNFKSVD